MLDRNAMPPSYPQPQGGKLRVRVVGRMTIGTERHAIVQPRDLILDLLRQLLIRLDFWLARQGTIAPAYQLIALRPEVGEAALLVIVERRTVVGPASLLILPSQKADAHGLNQLLVAWISQAIEEQDRQGERVGMRAGDRGT